MLIPKKTKYRKVRKGKNEGNATRGNYVAFGDYGLQSQGNNDITSRQIEASRQAMTRHIKRGGKIIWSTNTISTPTPKPPIPKPPTPTPTPAGRWYPVRCFCVDGHTSLWVDYYAFVDVDACATQDTGFVRALACEAVKNQTKYTSCDVINAAHSTSNESCNPVAGNIRNIRLAK